MSGEGIKETVRAKYGQAALASAASATEIVRRNIVGLIPQ